MEHRSITFIFTYIVTIFAGLPIPAVASNADPWTIDAIRACTLVLTHAADTEQWRQCVESVGDQRSNSPVLLRCASAIRWHSQTDGRTAGRKIGECLSKGGPEAGDR